VVKHCREFFLHKIDIVENGADSRFRTGSEIIAISVHHAHAYNDIVVKTLENVSRSVKHPSISAYIVYTHGQSHAYSEDKSPVFCGLTGRVW